MLGNLERVMRRVLAAALGRVSDLEYRAIRDKLRGLSCVTRFEEGSGLSGDE